MLKPRLLVYSKLLMVKRQYPLLLKKFLFSETAFQNSLYSISPISPFTILVHPTNAYLVL